MSLASLATTLVAALAGAALATLLKLPAAPLLGAMVGVAVVKLTSDLTFEIPNAGRWIVYCAVGWLLGQTVTKDALVVLRHHALAVILCVVLFLLFGLALAWGLWRFTDLDVHTALLATAPGGIAQMGALSAEAKVNAPLVLSVHVLRITSVIVLMSLGLKLMGGKS
jgi:membrane AbrB-like protein